MSAVIKPVRPLSFEKTFPNRWGGLCSVCGKWVEPGDGQCWKPLGTAHYRAAHHPCLLTPEDMAKVKAQQEAKALELQEQMWAAEQEAAMAKDLHDAAKARAKLVKLESTTLQTAYSDVHTTVYQFDPAASDDDLRLIFNESAGKGGGLRTYGGQRVTEILRESCAVIVVTSFHLCD